MIVVMIYPKPLDPYGVVTHSSGLTHTDYGFTGESYSPSTHHDYSPPPIGYACPWGIIFTSEALLIWK